MIAGANAFFAYAAACTYILMKSSLPTIVITASLLAVWLVVAILAWLAFLK